jgi:hypothetical protein
MSNSNLAQLLIRNCLAKIGHVRILEGSIEGVGKVSVRKRSRIEFLSHESRLSDVCCLVFSDEVNLDKESRNG